MRKSREGIGRLGAVLSLCLALALSGIPAYGAQCVDFIKAYYAWLGVEAAHGDAQDYRSNLLPDGFTRIENADPMPGDVLIYTGGKYGHVGIFESEFSTYHQNWGQPYVQELTARYDAISDARY